MEDQLQTIGEQYKQVEKDKQDKKTCRDYLMGFFTGASWTGFACFGLGMSFAYAVAVSMPFPLISRGLKYAAGLSLAVFAPDFAWEGVQKFVLKR